MLATVATLVGIFAALVGVAVSPVGRFFFRQLIVDPLTDRVRSVVKEELNEKINGDLKDLVREVREVRSCVEHLR